MTWRPGRVLFPALLLASLPVPPAAAQTVKAIEAPAPAGPGASEGWDSKRALAVMDRLRQEIVVLTGLKETQGALLGWNVERARTGAPPLRLPASLCREAALGPWCARLPATFEASAGGAASGEQPESGNGEAVEKDAANDG